MSKRKTGMRVYPTYFLPMQSRGPTENGWKAERSSLAYSESESVVADQRSGTKDSGFLNSFGEWYIAAWGAATVVYRMKKNGN